MSEEGIETRKTRAPAEVADGKEELTPDHKPSVKDTGEKEEVSKEGVGWREGQKEAAGEVKTGDVGGVKEEEAKKKIVIIDSKEKTLDRAISDLRKGAYKVVGVESTEEFFEVMEGNRSKETAGSDIKAISPEGFWKIQQGDVPDLIITDIDLKDLDGWEFIFRLKFDNRYYEYRDIPIIVRTEEPITVETAKKVQAESIHDYLPKSVKGAELQKKIDSYFELRAKLSEKKGEIAKALGYRVAAEYERISLAIRIRLKYLHAIKTKLEALKKEGGDPGEIKRLEESFYLQNREVLKYERRKREIKKLLKEKKDDGRAGSDDSRE